ncbi:hypothetical protein P12x_000875 [Tundrisphaera lichenicola]|uniref:hypothetical protein n=1 Tax=Tundrisphaera lichenicola TaxID=2029860 RepID=UPI003EB807E1
MIPIECPKCGREGSVPPDRLNAKLTCRGCQAVFHLDNTGRMVMGAPGDPHAKDKQRPQVRYSAPSEPFNFAESWSSIPVAAKIAVPVVLLAALAFQVLPRSGGPSYQRASESILESMVKNDRSGVISMSTKSSNEAAGKWFDVVRKQVDAAKVSADTPITPSLFSGNPDKDSSLVMMAVITGDSPSAPPIQLNVHMALEGSSWRLDGEQTLMDAERTVASTKK